MGTKQTDPKLAIKGKKTKNQKQDEVRIIDQMDIINNKVKISNGLSVNDIKRNKTVILCGTAPTLSQTPWNKKDTDFWACAPVITHKPAIGKKFDVLFEMHKAEYWMDQAVMDRINKYTDTYKNTVIMQDAFYQYKNSIKFPIEEIQNSVKNKNLKKYFTSSIAYMIALAVYLGYERIELYGIHMSSDEEEYSGQRSCCEAWLNYGLGKGIEYWLPDVSDVMKCTYLYGYQQEKGALLDVIHMKNGYVNAVKELEVKHENAKEDLWMHKGAVRGADLIIKELRRKGG